MDVEPKRNSDFLFSDGTNEGYSTIDRFRFDYESNNAGGTVTVSQNSTVPSGYGLAGSYKVDVTTITSLDSTHMITIRTILEAQSIRNSGWNYTSASSNITLSFWARSSKAGTYNIVLRALDAGANII